jgi:hypothetical protein
LNEAAANEEFPILISDELLSAFNNKMMVAKEIKAEF